MTIMKLTGSELRILGDLAVHRFLTAAQLLRLGVSPSQSHLYDRLGGLYRRRPKLIDRLEFGVLPGQGRLPRVYFLTRQGAETLADAIGVERIGYPTKVRPFTNDLFHRLATIDIHISLRLWASQIGARMDYFWTYFEHGAQRFAPKTRIPVEGAKSIDADAILKFTTPDHEARLCILEINRGRRTEQVAQKLLAFWPALQQFAIHDACGFDRNAGVRILSVSDDLGALELVARRLSKEARFEAMQPYFFFGTAEEIAQDFRLGWRAIDGQWKALFGSNAATG